MGSSVPKRNIKVSRIEKMTGNIFTSFKKTKGLIGIVAIGSLLALSFFIQDFAGRMRQMTVFADGVNTCFTRVNQSYTARILGIKSSTYLTPAFMSATEECFGESISTIESSVKIILGTTASLLNSLATKVHLFHEKINPEGKAVKNIDLDFARLEGLKNDIMETGESYQENVLFALSIFKKLFYVLSATILMFFAVQFFANKRKIVRNRRVEKEAMTLAENINSLANCDKVEEVLRSAMEDNDLICCSKLFSKYHTELLDGKINVFMPKVYSEERKESVTDTKEVVTRDSQTDLKVSRKNNQGTKIPTNSVNVDSVLTKVVDMLSSKIFTQGIVLDLKVEPDLNIMADEEALEQVLYHTIGSSISACSDTTYTKRISVIVKKMGGTVLMEIRDSGIGFSSEFIQEQVGLKQTTSMQAVGLVIAQELMKDIDGDISFDNIVDDQKMVVGGEMRLKFNLAKEATVQTSSRRLVSVKKGTKKDILRDITPV